MTSHVARLYALVLGVFVFFDSGAAVDAHPWATTATAAKDPRIAALVARQQRVQRESLRVQQVLQARSATGKAPAVKIVNLPPLTVTRVS